MDTSPHSDLNAAKYRTKQAAFSLVEVTMAIGIVAFAFMSVLGLIPTGMKSFRQAIDTSVGSQILQRVMNEAQQTDFNDLITDKNNTAIPGGSSGLKANRYFDDQGEEVMVSGTSAMPVSKIIYQVNTRITPTTTMPDGANYSDLATVTIQIANNPANLPLTPDSATNLWSSSVVPVSTYSGIVARSK